jgi:molybdenum cofactor cytidylyltransferase
VAAVFAVVPACGQSTRMGRPKLALPLGEQSVLERVVETLRAGGVERVVVVIGPNGLELAPLAASAGADVQALADQTPDMRTTVERGLDWIEERHHPALDDRWFLAPADHPAFAPSVVCDLLAAMAQGRHSIIVPTHEGRRGHPALFRWHHAAGIRAFHPNQGINSYLRSHTEALLELPVTDAGILANLDTPEDYAQLLGDHL